MNKVDNESIQAKKATTDCQKCENYRFAIMELRRQYVFRTLRYAMIFVFVALLSIVFHSYIPCVFLLLLFL